MAMLSTANAGALAAALCLLFAARFAQAASKNVDLKTLILTVPGWTEYDHAETVLRGYGAPYDVRAIQSSELSTLDVNALLTNTDGSGKYGFIIVTPANVINLWGNVLDLDQINQLYAYQEAFNVRLVLEGPYAPSFASDISGGPPGIAVAYVDPNNPAPPVATAKVAATAPLTTSGVKAGAPLDLTGLYATPVTITNTTRTKPVLTCESPAAYATGYTAVTTTFDSGREQLTTLFPCAAFSSDCLLVAHLYFAWGMHGIIPGARDSFFSTSIDDLFLSTVEPFNQSALYRVTASDLQTMAAFAAAVPNMPPGSNYRLEFAGNNAGYITATQFTDYYNVWDDASPDDVPQTFTKPPGSGADLMPHNPDTSWWNPTAWKKDGLYNEFAFGKAGLQFYWNHHTFNHEVLNNVTYYDALQQIRLNQAAAAAWNTTNGSFNRFSQTTMTTPGISGMRNVDALQALMDAGITAAVGDTSWPHLRNQENPWQAQVLTKANNGTVDGFYIIPRSPTNVYFDVSTEAVQVQLYNWLYCCDNLSCPTDSCEAGKPFTVPQTWSDILAAESLRVRRMMFALRPDGHMFHQANLRTSAGASNQSLLQQWVTAVIAAYSQRVSWPLQTLKLDDQLAYTKKRIARDACGLQYTLTYDDVTKSATALKITSNGGDCQAPVHIASTTVAGADPGRRVLGDEPPQYTVTLAAGASKTLDLSTSTGVNWA